MLRVRRFAHCRQTENTQPSLGLLPFFRSISASVVPPVAPREGRFRIGESVHFMPKIASIFLAHEFAVFGELGTPARQYGSRLEVVVGFLPRLIWIQRRRARTSGDVGSDRNQPPGSTAMIPRHQPEANGPERRGGRANRLERRASTDAPNAIDTAHAAGNNTERIDRQAPPRSRARPP